MVKTQAVIYLKFHLNITDVVHLLEGRSFVCQNIYKLGFIFRKNLI